MATERRMRSAVEERRGRSRPARRGGQADGGRPGRPASSNTRGGAMRGREQQRGGNPRSAPAHGSRRDRNPFAAPTTAVMPAVPSQKRKMSLDIFP